MKPNSLLLHVLGKQDGTQWVVMCLEFSLAAQADTLDEAKKMLRSQIVSYVSEATVGEDQEFAMELLSRRAPIKYWLMYWLASGIRHIGNHGLIRGLRGSKAFRTSLPLVPANA